MQFPVDDILPLIPQKPPFVMVNRLLHADDLVTKSSFKISSDNVMVKNGVFTEGGLMENIAQTAALRAGYIAQQENKPVESGYIGAVKDLEIFELPVAGDELVTEVALENQVFNVTVFKGKVWRGAQLLAQCEMKVFIE
ncbi:MAG TPA: 3-hydroxyacyl-ACP dehydratase [Mucilaginibacter sp.]